MSRLSARRALAILWLVACVVAPRAVHAACGEAPGEDGTPRFAPNGPESGDRMTGLIWQRCTIGTTWIDGQGCTGERRPITYPDAEAEAAKLGNGWRLPTARELASLIDQDCGTPAIDTRVFPDVSASTDEGAEEYWTSTPAGIVDMRYFIDFSIGYADIRSPGFERWARLVRPGT